MRKVYMSEGVMIDENGVKIQASALVGGSLPTSGAIAFSGADGSDPVSLAISAATGQVASLLTLKDEDGNLVLTAVQTADSGIDLKVFSSDGTSYANLSAWMDGTDSYSGVYLRHTGTVLAELQAGAVGDGGAHLMVQAVTGQTDPILDLVADGGAHTIRATGDNKLGFFNAAAAAKPTGVAVTAGGVHAALVTLGLIAA